MQNYYTWIIIGMVVLCPLLHILMHRKHEEHNPPRKEHDDGKNSKDSHSCCH